MTEAELEVEESARAAEREAGGFLRPPRPRRRVNYEMPPLETHSHILPGVEQAVWVALVGGV